jgi:hypothetical protein
MMRRIVALGLAILCLAPAVPSTAEVAQRIHGLWVWKGPAILAAPQGAERLRDFCRAEGVNEVYVSVFDHGDLAGAASLEQLIELLHHSQIRVEALLSSEDADEPGKHREKFTDHVRAIEQFNERHPRNRFDGIHLDIEPQQRTENKGPGNLRFLPGLLDAYRAARALAAPAGLTVNADIQNKLLKASLADRRALLQSLPRLTLMLYELSDANGGGTEDQQAATLRAASRKYLDMAYEGLHEPDLATMVIGLRTPDYPEQLPQMLKILDETNTTNPHYQGWARHSYNDVLKTQH